MTKEARALCIAAEKLLAVLLAPSEVEPEEGRLVAEAELERALKDFDFSESWHYGC